MSNQSGVSKSDCHGLPAVRLSSPDGASAVVTLHGAQVVSWIPAGGEERLYLSERSRFEADAAIRGGIPVIFPQFAAEGPLPRHGFARTAEWTLQQSSSGADFAGAVLRFTDTARTRSIWPHAFAAELTVVVGADRLDVELEVENRGGDDMRFTAALHTYLRVQEVETVRVDGLRGLHYRDQAAGGREDQESAEVLTIDREIDRIYFDAPATLLLREPRRSLSIHGEGFPDVVVWNPWDEKCAQLADMPALGFRRMLCIEHAVIGHPVRLKPGAAWWGRQSLQAY
ncbi:MAG: D-hexose-6-phosphate mutarotase [Pseudomonadota bacterium]